MKVAFNTGANSADIRTAEYSGVDPTNPVDVVVSAEGTGTVSDGPFAQYRSPKSREPNFSLRGSFEEVMKV